MVVWGKTFSVIKFNAKNISVSDMDKKSILKALYALKIAFVEQNNVLSEKNHSPRPLKLNECSTSIKCLLLTECYIRTVPEESEILIITL